MEILKRLFGRTRSAERASRPVQKPSDPLLGPNEQYGCFGMFLFVDVLEAKHSWFDVQPVLRDLCRCLTEKAPEISRDHRLILTRVLDDVDGISRLDRVLSTNNEALNDSLLNAEVRRAITGHVVVSPRLLVTIVPRCSRAVLIYADGRMKKEAVPGYAGLVVRDSGSEGFLREIVRHLGLRFQYFGDHMPDSLFSGIADWHIPEEFR